MDLDKVVMKPCTVTLGDQIQRSGIVQSVEWDTTENRYGHELHYTVTIALDRDNAHTIGGNT